MQQDPGRSNLKINLAQLFVAVAHSAKATEKIGQIHKRNQSVWRGSELRRVMKLNHVLDIRGEVPIITKQFPRVAVGKYKDCLFRLK